MTTRAEDEKGNPLQRNKAVVLRFNREVIEQGNEQSARELLAANFVNRTASAGVDPGVEGMLHMIIRVLRPALPDLRVEIHDQIAEGDRVTTRKTLHGTHRAELLGISATHKSVAIEVIDIVRVEEGRYVEHWGSNNLASVLAQLRAK